MKLSSSLAATHLTVGVDDFETEFKTGVQCISAMLRGVASSHTRL